MDTGKLSGIDANAILISNSAMENVYQIVKPTKFSHQEEVAHANQNTINMMELTVLDAQQDHGTMLILMTAFVNGDLLCKITNAFQNIDCCKI